MTTLINQQIPAAGTHYSDGTGDLGKVKALNIQARFVAGSGGTSVKAYVQTLVGGTQWADIACFAFTGSDVWAYQSVVADTAVNSPVALGTGDLSDNSSVNGIIGEQLRIQLDVAGDYTNASLAIDVAAKS